MTRDLIYHISTFLVFILLQMFVFNHLHFFEYGFCYIYIGFLLMLPYDLGKISGLLIGFATGLILDLFFQSGGIHTASSVFMMFVRPNLIGLINPKGGFEMGTRMTVSDMGWSWYLIYSIILVFLHHLVLFLLDAFNSAYILKALYLSAASTLFTIAMIFAVQLIAFNKSRT